MESDEMVDDGARLSWRRLSYSLFFLTYQENTDFGKALDTLAKRTR